MADFFTQVGQTNPTALAMGVVALLVLVLGQAFLKNRPVALLVVTGGVVAASLMNAGTKGVKLLGTIPQGPPPLRLPAVHWSDVDDLLPLAMPCFVLGAVETIAIGRMFARKQATGLTRTRSSWPLLRRTSAPAWVGDSWFPAACRNPW